MVSCGSNVPVPGAVLDKLINSDEACHWDIEDYAVWRVQLDVVAVGVESDC